MDTMNAEVAEMAEMSEDLQHINEESQLSPELEQLLQDLSRRLTQGQ